MTSLYGSEIERHFSNRKRDVKAFLFVQTNRDVARCASETRPAISRNNDSHQPNLFQQIKELRALVLRIIFRGIY